MQIKKNLIWLKLLDFCVCVKRKTLCNCLCSFSSPFLPFFCRAYPGFRYCKLVFLILKISQYGGSRRWVQFFPRYSCKNWFKNWYIDFCKTYDHQIWQACTISVRPMITKFGKYVHLQNLTQVRLIKQVLVTSLRQDHVTN